MHLVTSCPVNLYNFVCKLFRKVVFEFFAVIFGEDVAFGGVFRCTVGLKDKYGKFLFLFRARQILGPDAWDKRKYFPGACFVRRRSPPGRHI